VQLSEMPFFGIN